MRESPEGIFVIGMHRSGTSVVTNILDRLGLYVGTKDELLPPAEDNPNGFWERRDVKELNDKLLSSANASWHLFPAIPLRFPDKDFFDQEILSILKMLPRPWALKDPRFSLTLQRWRKAVNQCEILVVVRHPLAVATSLAQRNGFSIHAGLLLWEQYVTSYIKNLGNDQPYIIHYEELIAHPNRSIEKLVDFLKGCDT